MNRIVITGSFLTGKTEVSLALAHLTGFTHVYPMSNYEADKFIGSLNDDKNRFYRNFLNCLLRLSDRLKNETLTEENFISDGCVFNDIAYIKAYHDVISIGNNSINKKEFKEQTLMIQAIENSILYYSKDRYDKIVFLEMDPTTDLELSVNNQKMRIQYDDYLNAILQKSGYRYATYLNSDMELLLSKIVDDNNLNQTMTIKEALYKSQLNLYRKNTNLNSIKFN